jgi:hypothetical protein
MHGVIQTGLKQPSRPPSIVPQAWGRHDAAPQTIRIQRITQQTDENLGLVFLWHVEMSFFKELGSILDLQAGQSRNAMIRMTRSGAPSSQAINAGMSLSFAV